MAIGVALAAKAGVVDGAALADAGQHVLQDAAVGRVDTAHRWWRPSATRACAASVDKLVEADCVARPAAQRQRQIGAVAEIGGETAEPAGAILVRPVGHEDRDQTLGMRGDIAPGQVAGAFAGAALAERQQAAEPCIGRAIGRIDEQRRAVGQIEAAADDQRVRQSPRRPHAPGRCRRARRGR